MYLVRFLKIVAIKPDPDFISKPKFYFQSAFFSEIFKKR